MFPSAGQCSVKHTYTYSNKFTGRNLMTFLLHAFHLFLLDLSIVDQPDFKVKTESRRSSLKIDLYNKDPEFLMVEW